MKLLGKKLLIIVAHPDDESYGVSGTLFENKRAGGENAVICATKGGRGKSHLKKAASSSELKAIRTKEFESAMCFLKIKRYAVFDFPDGGLAKHRSPAYRKFLAFAREYEPDVIVSFGPDGMSGHLDHVATGKIARRVAAKLAVPFVAFAISPLLSRNFGELKKRRKFGVYAEIVKHEIPNIKVKIRPAVKLRLLRMHKSQMDSDTPFSRFSRAVRKKMLHYEFFREG